MRKLDMLSKQGLMDCMENEILYFLKLIFVEIWMFETKLIHAENSFSVGKPVYA